MKSYKEIEGWFDFEGTYDFLLKSVPEGGVFVEVGAWLGKSSSYLCSKANDKKIHIVDTWKGSPDELDTYHKLATETDIYEIFLSNMSGYEFTPHRSDSIVASKQFEDKSCDVVFIDATHNYESVLADVKAWLPKVKDGGYISGHDYASWWPGVVKAIDEVFGDKVIVMNGCWIYKKDN